MRLRGEMTGRLEMVSVRLQRRHCLRALVLGAFLCAVPTSAAFAQISVTAGDTSALAGTTASVPISMALPAGTPCATLQFNLTVVANGGAPAVSTNVSFASLVGAPSSILNSGPATVLVGWFTNFNPLLTGTVQLGTLSVPIPAGATGGQTYTVEVINPSATSDGSTDLGNINSVNGTITVGGGSPTDTPTVVPATDTPTVVPATDTPTVVPPTSTPTNTPTITNTPLPTGTPTLTPINTQTATPTHTPVNTATPTQTATQAPTNTPVPVAPVITGGTVAGLSRVSGHGALNIPEPQLEICSAGVGGTPGNCVEILGTGGTNASGNFLQGGMSGIGLNRPLVAGEVVFAVDLQHGVTGPPVTVQAGAPIPDVTPWGAAALGLALLIAIALRMRLTRVA
jgi:hypothetical protein